VASFITVLVFSPMLLMCAWWYTSPLALFGQRTVVKAAIRLVSCVAMLGGICVQLNYLRHNLPIRDLRIGVNSLLVIEGIPMIYIGVRGDLKRRRFKSANRTDVNGVRDNAARGSSSGETD
jgi:hypothetical protein